MKAGKYIADSVTQRVNPEKYYPRLSHWFLVTTSYSDRNIKVNGHVTKSLTMPENTQTKCLHTRNYPKSECTMAEFWHIPDNLHPCSLSVFQISVFASHTMICHSPSSAPRANLPCWLPAAMLYVMAALAPTSRLVALTFATTVLTPVVSLTEE